MFLHRRSLKPKKKAVFLWRLHHPQVVGVGGPNGAGYIARDEMQRTAGSALHEPIPGDCHSGDYKLFQFSHISPCLSSQTLRKT